MDRQELRRTLRSLVEDTTGEPCPELEDDRGLRDELGLDSVDLFSLIVDMQSHFQIKIGGDEMEQISTVGALLDLLQAKVAQKASGSHSTAA